LQAGDGAVEGERGEEDFESFGQGGGRVIREEWTERGEGEGDAGGAGGDGAAGEIGDEEAGEEVEEDLNEEHGAEVPDAEDGEDGGEK